MVCGELKLLLLESFWRFFFSFLCYFAYLWLSPSSLKTRGVFLTAADNSIPFVRDTVVESGSCQGQHKLVADLDTLQVIPWCPSHARVFAKSFSHSEEDPALNLLDGRSWLFSVTETLLADFGLSVKASIEEEFYVLCGSDAAGWVPVDNSTYAVGGCCSLLYQVYFFNVVFVLSLWILWIGWPQF
jgi:hypothetical protein